MNTESNLEWMCITSELAKLFQVLLQDFLAFLLDIGTEREKLMNPIYLKMLKLLTPETENPVYPIHLYWNSQSQSEVPLLQCGLDFLAARAYMFTYQGLFKSPSNTTACSFSYTCKNFYKQIHTTTQSITTPKRSYQIQKEKQSSNELLEQISFISLGNLPYIAEYHRQ